MLAVAECLSCTELLLDRVRGVDLVADLVAYGLAEAVDMVPELLSGIPTRVSVTLRLSVACTADR